MRFILFLACALVSVPSFAEDDAELSFMADGDGREFVYLLCADCHSMQHVLEKRHTRSGWRGALERMTLDFGMADLEPDERKQVLDYLSQNYGIGR